MSPSERLREVLRVHRTLTAAELTEFTEIPRAQLPVYIARLVAGGCQIRNLAAPPAAARYRMDFDPDYDGGDRSCVWPGCGCRLRKGKLGWLCDPHQACADAHAAEITLLSGLREEASCRRS